MSDLLRMDYINSLPQPFLASMIGGGVWPIFDICVETGCVRLDICGLLEVSHISEIKLISDVDGGIHDPETFYSDYEPGPQSGTRGAM